MVRLSSMMRPDAPPSAASGDERGWLRSALLANLVLQMLIIVTGGLVRLTGSGLGCSEWPQCTPGSFTPVAHQVEGYHSLIEFGNRLITFVLVAVGIALIYGARRWASDRRRFLALSAVPLIGVLAQAVLGGIIVWSKLDPKTVSPHFLLSLLLVAYSAWLVDRFDHGDGALQVAVHPLIARMTYLACAATAVVVVLGTAVTGSGPHSGDKDEPIRFGFDPRTTSWLHADAVMLLVGLVVAIVVASRISSAPARFRWWWSAILVVCAVQGIIGYTQFFTGLPIALVTIHLAGSAVLTAAIAFGTLAARQRT